MSEREAWVWRNGELVEKGGPLDIRLPVARGAFPTPFVIGDTQPDLICHADGKRERATIMDMTFDLALNLVSVWGLCLAAFLSLAERALVREGW